MNGFLITSAARGPPAVGRKQDGLARAEATAGPGNLLPTSPPAGPG